MHTREFTAGLLLGMWAGSLLMAVVGHQLQRQAAPYRTLPAPADTYRAPVPELAPGDLIPPQHLPTGG